MRVAVGSTSHSLIRRAALMVVLLLGACTKPPEAHPVIVTLEINDGKVTTSCIEWSGMWEHVSLRDVAKTARDEGDTGRSCVVPVRWSKERFLLQSLACDGIADIYFTVIGIDGSAGNDIGFRLTPDSPRATQSFGAGFPLMYDLQLSGQGTARCQLSGLYVRTTDSAKIWGPYRIVSHAGTFHPNDD